MTNRLIGNWAVGLLLALWLALSLHPAWGADAPKASAATGLDNRVQDVKGDVIRLNRDLLVLEEELLFPANTQVALFVSMDVGKLFSLDSVQVTLDDKVVSNYLYTPLEVQALHRGGVQRVHLGNLKSGEHTLTAFFTGKGPHDRDYKRGTSLKFEKSTGAKYIELRIKELHHGLEIDRTSCTRFWANQFRVLLTAAAYALMQELRTRAAGTSCARAQVSTLRERLLKLGVWVTCSVRRIGELGDKMVVPYTRRNDFPMRERSEILTCLPARPCRP